MLRRLIFPLVIGLLGAAILFWLGTWQVQRLNWKQDILNEIDIRIAAEAVALPETPTKAAHQFLPVTVTGEIGKREIPVLASTKQVGAIFRMISPFRMADGRIILIDRGYVLDELKNTPRPIGVATLTGNLLWPDEIDKYTPKPDLQADIWFARDIVQMAEHLKTEPVLLVVRETSLTDTPLTPLPVDTSGIPNDHLEYAVTWYGLCIVWLMMSGLMAWRLTRKDES